MIIAENKKDEFEKVKSKISAKEFAKTNIKYNNHYYDNSSKFYVDYFGNNISLLIQTIREYAELKVNHMLKINIV